MTIGNFHANFDPATYEQFMAIIGKGNIRRTIEQFMIQTINTYNGNIEGIDLQLLEIELDKKNIQKTKLEAEIKNLLATRNKILQEKQKKDEENLIKEKEIIESKKKCLNCNKVIVNDKRSQNFKKGIVCWACYQDAEMEQIRKWNDD